MRPTSVVLAALAAVLLAPAAHACSMCQCGDPTYRLVGDEYFSSNRWRFSLDADRYAKDQPGEDDPALRERERESRVTLAATWTPRPWLRLVGRLPVARRTIASGDANTIATGLADPDVLAHVRLAGDSRSWIAAMVGTRVPLGNSDVRTGGERADEHAQPGTGAWAGMAGVAAARELAARTHGYASVTARRSGTNAHGYRYGDALLASLAVQRDLAPRSAAGVELDYRDARADRLGGADVEATGGRVLYVAPRVQRGLGESLALELGVQVPVWSELAGDQRERVNLLAGITLAF